MTATFDQPPEAKARLAELRQQLETRIDQLPDPVRTVFILRGVEELSQAETALALDLSQGTVRARFLHARSLLRDGFARDFDAALPDAFSLPAEPHDQYGDIGGTAERAQIFLQRDRSSC